MRTRHFDTHGVGPFEVWICTDRPVEVRAVEGPSIFFHIPQAMADLHALASLGGTQGAQRYSLQPMIDMIVGLAFIPLDSELQQATGEVIAQGDGASVVVAEPDYVLIEMPAGGRIIQRVSTRRLHVQEGLSLHMDIPVQK